MNLATKLFLVRSALHDENEAVAKGAAGNEIAHGMMSKLANELAALGAEASRGDTPSDHAGAAPAHGRREVLPGAGRLEDRGPLGHVDRAPEEAGAPMP